MRRTQQAFTLVELLVCIAIIGILVGLSSPALQAMRESSRRVGCQSRLVPIGLAIQTYHDRWQQLPVGTLAESGPIRTEAKGNHHNWLGRLADLLDQPVIAARINRSISVYDAPNDAVLNLAFPAVKCPSSGAAAANASSFVGIHHPIEKPIDETDHGVFVLNKPISFSEITDGLSNTAFVAEKLPEVNDLGWLSGTRATLRNVGSGIQSPPLNLAQPPVLTVGSIGSLHPAGTHILLGSGAIQFLSTQTDSRILQQLADRRDGQLPTQFQSIEEQRRQSLQ